MAIAPWSCYSYQAVLHGHRDRRWSGTAEDDGSPSLLGRRPSVIVTGGHVTMTRRWREILQRSSISRAGFDAGEALAAVLRQWDRLACWRGGTGEIGMSVTRGGSLVLGLGTLGRAPGANVTIDHDPRVEERQLACDMRYMDRPGTHIVWLDPDRPRELAARLRELDGGFPGVNRLAIVVRADDRTVTLELNRRTMGPHRRGLGATIFLTAAKRFSGLEEWLQYARALSTERPRDLWLRVRCGSRDCQVVEGKTAAIDDWLVHVLRVYEPGLPGSLSQLGLVRADAGVTPAMLERSTAAIANGLTLD